MAIENGLVTGRPPFQPACTKSDKLTSPSPPPDSIALAFELLTPLQVCAAFSMSLHRAVHYTHSSTINISVPIPPNYHSQLEGVKILFGQHNAPYFGPEITAPDEARSLWAGWRGVEEYAREVFPMEESANGMVWMHDDAETNGNTVG